MEGSQDIETVTTAITTDAQQPDSKTRRYDRQLRLWAATGQSALEASRILVISGSATSTSVLKNLVLPGIGHFTILDPAKVTFEDAGNNFFLESQSSIGKYRAEEAVRLLGELNEDVDGKADLRSLKDVLETDQKFLLGFTIVIVHNIEPQMLDKLSEVLWQATSGPALVVVRSAGFLAEFFIQFHEHTIIESHSETAPSLRIDNPFPALLNYAMSLDLENMDITDHGHVPYVVILVRALEEWKKTHNGSPPTSYPEKQEFKKAIQKMKRKFDEENIDEAEAQAYRCWGATVVPPEIVNLFQDPRISNLDTNSPVFFHLVAALKKFTEEQPTHTLPLTSTLPDMKASTTDYIHLQKLYKTRAEEEKEIYKQYLTIPIENGLVDLFLKNSHALKVIRGKRWGWIDNDPAALSGAVETSAKSLSVHLSLSALSALTIKQQITSEQALTEAVQAFLPPETALPNEFGDAIGEIARAPTADLPNTAALLGGLVAQEVIKMITKQYIPIEGYCIVDLIETWTGML